MGRPAIDLSGQRFGRLVVVRRVGSGNNGDALWLAKCDCGGELIDRAFNLKRGKGCGCWRSERMRELNLVHGHYIGDKGTRTYKSWLSMRARCNGSDPLHAKYYKDRGVVVCDRWDDFRNFLADMGERPDGMTLDRIDANGNYEPSNCRWADNLAQRHNRRA